MLFTNLLFQSILQMLSPANLRLFFLLQNYFARKIYFLYFLPLKKGYLLKYKVPFWVWVLPLTSLYLIYVPLSANEPFILPSQP